jgi:hypothetical protein
VEYAIGQRVIAELTPHGDIAVELVGGGDMQGYEPRFMKLGLPDMQERRQLGEFDICHGEAESFANAQPRAGEEPNHS